MKLEHEKKADDDEIRFADDDDSEIRVPEPTHGNEQVGNIIVLFCCAVTCLGALQS